MFNAHRLIIAVTATLSFAWSPSYAQEHGHSDGQLILSQELHALLQAEMREIASASQALVLSLASGDWKAIERISEQIRASYVMERQLTAAQRQELASKLPEHFKKLDMDFHARARKLGKAAAARDPEIAAFQTYRLIESCAACHAAFAQARFPGFSAVAPEVHAH